SHYVQGTFTFAVSRKSTPGLGFEPSRLVHFVAQCWLISSMPNSSFKRRVKFALKRLRYFGSGRVCPICSGKSRRFADFGYSTRHDAQCVWCGSLERHRLVWLYLQRKLFPSLTTETARFLHIAPEPCLEPK